MGGLETTLSETKKKKKKAHDDVMMISHIKILWALEGGYVLSAASSPRDSRAEERHQRKRG